jgi:hypothetical protein
MAKMNRANCGAKNLGVQHGGLIFRQQLHGFTTTHYKMQEESLVKEHENNITRFNREQLEKA